MEKMLKEIKSDITTLSVKELHDKLLSMYPYDVAQILLQLDEEEKLIIYKSLSKAELADIMEYLETDETVEILENMSPGESAEIISNMESDDAVDIIQALDEDIKEEIREKITSVTNKELKELAKYEENMAGSIMTNNFFMINIDTTIQKAMKKLVSESDDKELIDIIFVVNDNRELLGTIDLKDLIVARKEDLISDIMDSNCKVIEDTDNIKDATFILQEYNLLALPVVENKVLKGIITIDDVIDYVDEEASEDYDKLAGLTGENNTTLSSTIKSRLPWLIILLLLSFIVSSILGMFEEIIASATILVFFQTLVLDMGGNAGTQSLANSVVSLSKSELEEKHKVRTHLLKELLSGILEGLILGICSFIVTLIFMLIRETTGNVLMISLVIGISMMTGISISNFVGTVIPIIFYRLKIDPAVASGPFITTINDMLGVIIYYSLAYIILIQGGFLL